ncbi:MAG: DUF3795 domain-containing protein [Desulfobacterales bacterium]|nr:DUF3795 domain-containing protein [Desulfobacterales bacterium]
MTAPCGRHCFNCHFFLAHEDKEAMSTVKTLSEKFSIPVELMLCNGCRKHNGQIPIQKQFFGDAHRCAAYECSQSKRSGVLWGMRPVSLRQPAPLCRQSQRSTTQH